MTMLGELVMLLEAEGMEGVKTLWCHEDYLLECERVGKV